MTLALAFLGGLISCLSPCVLPVIPVFVSHLAGGMAPPSLAGAGASGSVSVGGGVALAGRARASGFLLGFAGVFVALWVSIGLGGFALFDAVPVARQLAGFAIVGLGVATIAGWQPILRLGRRGGASSFGGSWLLGAGIAVGWTPCIGPTLGAILTLAAASTTVWAGTALLVAYAIGMAVPFIVVAFALARVRPLMNTLARHRRTVQVLSGGFIAIVGLLVATNAFSRLAGLVPWIF